VPLSPLGERQSRALSPRPPDGDSNPWLSRCRRLNIVHDRAADLFAGHIWIAMISIIARRLVAQTQAQQGI
jgi:hypothetical protein